MTEKIPGNIIGRIALIYINLVMIIVMTFASITHYKFASTAASLLLLGSLMSTCADFLTSNIYNDQSKKRNLFFVFCVFFLSSLFTFLKLLDPWL